MKNPLNHQAIEHMGLEGLGNDPAKVLSAYLYYIESITYKQHEALKTTLPIHDRLLESTLVIFDAMLNDKHSLKRLYGEILLSPGVLKDFICAERGFFKRMFSVIDLNEDGVIARGRLHMYMLCFNTWLNDWFKDESIDQSDTMAEIDQNLRQLHDWKMWICGNFPF